MAEKPDCAIADLVEDLRSLLIEASDELTFILNLRDLLIIAQDQQESNQSDRVEMLVDCYLCRSESHFDNISFCLTKAKLLVRGKVAR